MAQIDVPLVRSGFGRTRRADNWWVRPLAVFFGLSIFIVYSTWAALQGVHFRFGPYLSPFYSPELFGPAHQGWFGQTPKWIPAWVTGAMLILWAPGGFRLTCYYYRGAYYKAFWADPPSCTVGEPRKTYLGERSFPLIIQNIHRYFLYLALVFLIILARDVWDCFLVRWPIWHGGRHTRSVDQPGAADLLHPGLPFFSPSGRRCPRSAGGSSGSQANLRLRKLPESAPHAVCLVQSVFGRVLRFVCADVLDGVLARLEDLLVAEYMTHEHDVLIIGAGGAGLRAAVEASAAGTKVAVITKSLLGKAHTVMAEGGIAAAIGNVDDRDNWRVHFSDTMRGGQYLNNWRMAELHAKEAPARVRELEAWGALFYRIERKESRGAHFRDDFPAKDDQYGKFNILVRKGPDGKPRFTREPIPAMPQELQQVIQEMK